ncbi:MAG: hypothetical protein DLM73_02995 [Chthoniobacterales bacterium]|nr:MAG: hypothetical protein DLM73_02995 [Chthoniobacterales bacterium]
MLNESMRFRSLSRLILIVPILVAMMLNGCASENLSVDEKIPVAGETTPHHDTGPRGGWGW